MSNANERSTIEQFSRGEITRAEAARRLDEEISFSDMIRKLWQYELPLPVYKTDPNSVGIRLIAELAGRETHA